MNIYTERVATQPTIPNPYNVIPISQHHIHLCVCWWNIIFSLSPNGFKVFLFLYHNKNKNLYDTSQQRTAEILRLPLRCVERGFGELRDAGVITEYEKRTDNTKVWELYTHKNKNYLHRYQDHPQHLQIPVSILSEPSHTIKLYVVGYLQRKNSITDECWTNQKTLSTITGISISYISRVGNTQLATRKYIARKKNTYSSLLFKVSKKNTCNSACWSTRQKNKQYITNVLSLCDKTSYRDLILKNLREKHKPDFVLRLFEDHNLLKEGTEYRKNRTQLQAGRKLVELHGEQKTRNVISALRRCRDYRSGKIRHIVSPNMLLKYWREVGLEVARLFLYGWYGEFNIDDLLAVGWTQEQVDVLVEKKHNQQNL